MAPPYVSSGFNCAASPPWGWSCKDSSDVVGLRVLVPVPHPEARPLREDGRALVAHAVEDGGGERLVAVEDVDPVLVSEVAGDHHAAGLVAGADELEEEVGPARVRGEVPELVHDEELRGPVLFHGGGDASLGLRGGQCCQVVKCLQLWSKLAVPTTLSKRCLGMNWKSCEKMVL